MSTSVRCWCFPALHQNDEPFDTLGLGEQIFLGRNLPDSAFSCVKCHNIIAQDTFSWYPTALEIAENFAEKDIVDYEEVLLYGMSEQMYTSHEYAEEFTEKEFAAIKVFFQKVNEDKTEDQDPIPIKAIVLLICATILVFLIIDKFYFKLIKVKNIHGYLPLFILIFIAIYIYRDIINLGLQKNYEPNQPIKFSHKIHSAQNGTTCLYCHPSARYSSSAGVAGMNVCMNCHVLVREGSHSGEYEIKKLINAFENNRPIQWIRVNNLPEHVKFDHSIHYSVGKIDCSECHGVIEEMDRVKQQSELSMIWCLDCHKKRSVKFLENDYYAQFTSFQDEIKIGVKDSITVKDIGGWDCMNCHY